MYANPYFSYRDIYPLHNSPALTTVEESLPEDAEQEVLLAPTNGGGRSAVGTSDIIRYIIVFSILFFVLGCLGLTKK